MRIIGNKRIKADGTETIMVGAYIPAALRKSLEELAAKDERTLSKYIERVLRKHVEETSAAKATAA